MDQYLQYVTQDTGDRQDERPQVVQLSKSDLTAEEAKKHWDSELTEDKPGSSVQGQEYHLICSSPLFADLLVFLIVLSN